MEVRAEADRALELRRSTVHRKRVDPLVPHVGVGEHEAVGRCRDHHRGCRRRRGEQQRKRGQERGEAVSTGGLHPRIVDVSPPQVNAPNGWRGAGSTSRRRCAQVPLWSVVSRRPRGLRGRPYARRVPDEQTDLLRLTDQVGLGLIRWDRGGRWNAPTRRRTCCSASGRAHCRAGSMMEAFLDHRVEEAIAGSLVGRSASMEIDGAR